MALALALRFLLADPAAALELVAHRGLHPVADPARADRDCPDTFVTPGGPATVENTLRAFAEAFALGATMVELDLRRSVDDALVVFHDERVDCRTDGSGRIDELTLAELAALDAGHDYTDDDGRSHRWRGLPHARIPSLDAVLARFPGRALLIHQKALDGRTTELLAARLAQLPPERQARIHYWGPEETFARLRARAPRLAPRRFLAWGSLRLCLLRHATLGWLGAGVGACGGQALLLPAARVASLPGALRRFATATRRSGATLYLVAQRPEDLAVGAPLRIDGVMTDRVEVLAPHLRQASGAGPHRAYTARRSGGDP